MQLCVEMSSAKAQYSALHKEIDTRVLKGEDIDQLKKDRDDIFNFYNGLLSEHHNLFQYMKENNLRSRSNLPQGLKFQK